MEDKDFRDMSRELEFLMPEDSLRRFVREKKEDLKTKVFGRDIFNNNKLTFEPEMNIATPSDYRLGPGDAVYVDVLGRVAKAIHVDCLTGRCDQPGRFWTGSGEWTDGCTS